MSDTDVTDAELLDDGDVASADVLLNTEQVQKNVGTMLAKPTALAKVLNPIQPGKEDDRRLQQYADALAPATKVDERIGVIVQALAEGRVLVDVNDVLKRQFMGSVATGAHGRKKMHLALAPADALAVKAVHYENGVIEYASGKPHTWKRDFAIGDLAAWETSTLRRGRWVADAQVPQIPPSNRADHDLSKRLILWEAQWQNEATYIQEHDPALLEPLHGSICIVHSVWEMTPIEVAALTADSRPLL